ncbi:uncharacterized protein LOC128717776 [Anopheles marshallii]|uniref:uncharacterized protein LOC128717776 n=1 Tax=Anopheles marshallii TaxID=1521116 RepID=UPI00237A997F|nr:uncharacterized protein LOC128717776 [Anopheles marshallii]
MVFRFLVALVLIDVSWGQNEYPSYPDETSANTPAAYPNPDYGANPQPNPAPQYPDYSQVETVATTTAAATTTQPPRTRRTRRPQVFPPTPTQSSQTRRIVRWLVLDDQGYPIRTAVRRRFRTGTLSNWVPPYYRSLLSGPRSTRSNAARGQSQRVAYTWFYA